MLISRGKSKKSVLLMSFLVLSGLFFSCGLDEVTYVTEPTVTSNNPLYTNSDFLTWYSDFSTKEHDQSDSFIGTDVYYKIYNNYSNLVSQRNSILSVNTAANNSAAASRMIETYKFQSLGTNIGTDTVFLPATLSDRRLRIRLKTYKGNESYVGEDIYTRRACVIGAKFGTDGSVIPYRNGNSKSFDFFDDDEDNKGGSRDVIPIEGDADYYHSATASEKDTFYVQMFAVGVVFDQTSLSNSFSLVLDLGSVPIRKGN